MQSVKQKIIKHIRTPQHSHLLLLDPIQWSGDMSDTTVSTSVGVVNLADLNQLLKNKVIIRAFVVEVTFTHLTAEPLPSSLPTKDNSPESKSRQHSAKSTISGRSSNKSIEKKGKVCHEWLHISLVCFCCKECVLWGIFSIHSFLKSINVMGW